MSKEKLNAVFFEFSAAESEASMRERLERFKARGMDNVILSYKGQGMQELKFDWAYYQALDRVVALLKETGIRFWLEDYAPFPTGSASGAYKEPENTSLNKLFLDERHVDLTGPLHGAVIRIDALTRSMFGKAIHRFSKNDPLGRKRLAVIACRLADNPRSAAAPFLDEESAVLLDARVENGLLTWNVPEGNWRVFSVFISRESSGRANFMNLLSRASVQLEIKKVHKPLYEHLKDELGKSWIGFFYDEPEIGNSGGDAVFDFFMLPGRRSRDWTDIDTLPWSEEMPEALSKRDPDWLRHLPALWYDGIGAFRETRLNYMDAVSVLVRENYNGQVYAFCREKGIRYFGHVLEDEGVHTRLGCGAAHYFRQQYYQDESGIDVIAGQILPGRDRAISWYGVPNSDGEFYHYGLAKLASSEAHINPIKQGECVAECYAMYGQQGLRDRKFLMDHLFVNGVNRLLYMPEFFAGEADVCYEKLTAYADTMCALLRASKPITKAAVLYHAEAEWREGEQAQKFQRPAAELARHQISYDVIPADVFSEPERYQTDFREGLSINGNRYEALIIPGCSTVPAAVKSFIDNASIPVFFCDRAPEGCMAIPLDRLAEAVLNQFQPEIRIEGTNSQWLRLSHLDHHGNHLFLLHNEAPTDEMDLNVTIENAEHVTLWEQMEDLCFLPEQEKIGSGTRVKLHLGRYEMAVLCADGEKPAIRLRRSAHEGAIHAKYPDDYRPLNWYGRIVYDTSLFVRGEEPSFLDLGSASDIAEVYINGKSVGVRMAAPYLFDVRGALRPGENKIAVKLTASAGNKENPGAVFGIPLDALTAVPYTLSERQGILGPVEWLTEM